MAYRIRYTPSFENKNTRHITVAAFDLKIMKVRYRLAIATKIAFYNPCQRRPKTSDENYGDENW